MASFRHIIFGWCFYKYLLSDHVFPLMDRVANTFLQRNRCTTVSKRSLDVTPTQDKVAQQRRNYAMSALMKRHYSITYWNILMTTSLPKNTAVFNKVHHELMFLRERTKKIKHEKIIWEKKSASWYTSLILYFLKIRSVLQKPKRHDSAEL